MKEGRVQIYTGEGKGKTTAAVGSIIRAAGWGMKIAVFQFLKGRETGEEIFLRSLKNVKYQKVNLGKKFYFQMDDNEKEKTRAEAVKAFKEIAEAVENGIYDMVVADEIICCGELGIIEKNEIERLIKRKHCNTELILTGRGAWKTVIELADTVTEMRKIKHPYDNGIEGKQGSEF